MNVFRKEIINKRKNIPNKQIKSNIIFHKIIETDIYKKSKTIALYNSLENEVSTKELITYSLNNNKEVYLPKVVGEKLLFYKISSDEEFVLSSFNIKEPKGDNSKLMKEVDLVIVPGVAFDKECNRMGYGKGFYDRFLENRKTYKIGICFKEQIVEKIITFPHDIKMDEIITD